MLEHSDSSRSKLQHSITHCQKNPTDSV